MGHGAGAEGTGHSVWVCDFLGGAEWLSLKVLQACGFAVENIITIPYVNENLYENNIFAGAIKWEL